MSLQTDNRGVIFNYSDVSNQKQTLCYDAILSELTIAGALVPLLNLSRVSQTEHIIVLTYLDGSSRVYVIKDTAMAKTFRLCVYMACTAYALEKACHVKPILGLLDATQLNKDCVNICINRIRGAQFTDANPQWIYKVIVLTTQAHRLEYNLDYPEECQRLRVTHFTNL